MLGSSREKYIKKNSEGKIEGFSFTRSSWKQYFRLKKLVYNFINYNFQKNKRILLIITGKGKRLFVEDEWKATGILKTKIPVWLTSLALSKKIVWFDHAPLNMGGEGAFIIYLKKLTE